MAAPDVTILGAGIAGLACAVACAGRRLSVEIIEQAPRLTEVGAGLQVAPNGWCVLDALGVSPLSRESQAVHLIDGPTGRSVIRMPLGPLFHLVHRADLIAALAARAEALGVVVRLGCQVTGIEDDGRVLRLGDGTNITARRLIGADGARGPARAFVSPEHQGRFTGQVAWRAIVPVEHWPDEAQVHMGPGRHLVCYPLRDGRHLNIVAVEERSDWVDAGWSHSDDPANLRAAFAGYAAPIREVLERVEAVNLWGLMDHGATRGWHRGVCTLIGDAAHPTLPFLAQGANLGLEDAFTLAGQLNEADGWQAARQPRVTRALAAAAGNARNYHLSGLRRVVGHGALRGLGRVAPTMPLRAFGWLYDHDVTG